MNENCKLSILRISDSKIKELNVKNLNKLTRVFIDDSQILTKNDNVKTIIEDRQN